MSECKLSQAELSKLRQVASCEFLNGSISLSVAEWGGGGGNPVARNHGYWFNQAYRAMTSRPLTGG